MELQPAEVDYKKARQVYEQYKKEQAVEANKQFFEEQKEKEWFQDKYLPERQEKASRERAAEVQRKASEFVGKLGAYREVNWTVSEQAINSIKVDGGVYVENSHQECIEVMVKDTVDLTHSPYFAGQFNPYTIYIRCIPPNVSHWDLLP